MKKLIALFTLAGLLTFAASSMVYAQDKNTKDAKATTEQVENTEDAAQTPAEEVIAEDTDGSVAPETDAKPLHQQLKIKIIEGGPMFMGFVILTLILGLALCFERIIYLNFATTNTNKLLNKVEDALNEGGIEAAKEVCRNTRGPVASIFYQGLDRYEAGIDVVEKSVVSYGSVQMGQLENGLTWIALFIALAPMLGFMGTVIGMIGAFDAIEAAGDINPSLVAGGIKVALITTVSGLVVAMILQVFYNYIIGKIDSIVNSMEDASISLIDILVEFKEKK
ncbi:MAG: MotA/TolQ/ExbB proton channel family protein [Bacteroidales bacterium]|jgi:biopolymer transport protein ExbB|nr:MotA/TolQ/ExbB proton channel family protein [Bacteroidales bacterium]MDD4216579.1 MotA/TolQ/ExbB proton channel family protein [Bacteroidales bacterium]MDY0141344.1 MotA/TolQ/ExbB proton channel family protein [Bacteroidales bacterium]